jgi:hypothetical protein
MRGKRADLNVLQHNMLSNNETGRFRSVKNVIPIYSITAKSVLVVRKALVSCLVLLYSKYMLNVQYCKSVTKNAVAGKRYALRVR